MFLRSENGEIEVFLCPDHKALKDDPERSEEEAIVPSTSNDSLYKSNHVSTMYNAYVLRVRLHCIYYPVLLQQDTIKFVIVLSFWR